MQKQKPVERSYFWLKVLVIAIVIVTAALLITRQYLILVESVVCVIAGLILYRVVKHKLENPSISHKATTQEYKQQEVKVKIGKQQQPKTLQQLDNEFIIDTIKKATTKDLIAELVDRGQIK